MCVWKTQEAIQITVYIPTLDRVDMIQKTVPHWLVQEMPVRLVVERREYRAYTELKNRMKWGKQVYILPLPLAGRGIGYARNYAVKHARATHLDAIIMSDDDVYIHDDSDAWDLIDAVEKPGVLGVGAVRTLHDRFTNGAISRNHGVILCPGGWGFTVKALNVQTALKCGNFDPALHSFGEDAELARQGIARGIPWRVHCDVVFVSLNKRLDPGGFSSKYHTLEGRLAGELECRSIIHKRWPDYTSEPDKRPRVAWQRMLDDYIPEWRNYSVLHGGDISKLRSRNGT
jgi:glycosyltransferase involved in cell wall biosynthesis